MRRARLSIVSILVMLVFGITNCAPAPAQPTSAPPTSAPAKQAAPAEKPAEKAAAPAKVSGPPVKIGFITALSGPFASYGGALKYAPTIVLKDANESGGINGSPVELVTEDGPNNPAQVVTLVRKLANETQVPVIVGPYFTAEVEVAAPLATQLKIPLITTSASGPGLVDKHDWAFRASVTDDVNTPTGLDAFKKTYPNVKKMAIVGDVQNSVTSVMIKQLWPRFLAEKGYEIVDTITFETATTDFSAIVTRIKASGTEGVAMSALTPVASNLLKEMERQGVKIPVVSSGHIHSVPIFPKIAGSAANGLIVPVNFNPDRISSEPRVKEWMERYQAAAAAGSSGGEKPIIGFAQEPQTYDIFVILVKIMRDAGIKPDTPVAEAREKIRAGLMNVKDYPGIAGNLTTKPNRDITWTPQAVIAKDGLYTTVK